MANTTTRDTPSSDLKETMVATSPNASTTSAPTVATTLRRCSNDPRVVTPPFEKEQGEGQDSNFYSDDDDEVERRFKEAEAKEIKEWEEQQQRKRDERDAKWHRERVAFNELMKEMREAREELDYALIHGRYRRNPQTGELEEFQPRKIPGIPVLPPGSLRPPQPYGIPPLPGSRKRERPTRWGPKKARR